MSARALLLILFLYTALAWVFAFLVSQEERFVRNGLLLTGIGLALALVAVIVHQILNVWRAHRTQAGPKPLKPIRKPSVVSEEAAALDTLRREALARLNTSPNLSKVGGQAFAGRSILLVLGPSNSGKTQTLMNSGLDPQLLAGQVRGESTVVPTRVANFWLAQDKIFVELSGRLYDSDQERWIGLLKVLSGELHRPLWNRLWRDEQKVQLRGVVLVHDVQCAMAPPDSVPTGAQSRVAQERLQAVADVFGATVPVYTIFTKCDAVKYFGEYFGRVPQNEASQAFGYTMAADQTAVPTRPMPWSEKETRRLTRAFGVVYRHLAERRLLHLLRESDPARKPDIYEFPREFRRIRGVLVQLLTDTFKPDPLKPGPVLRGFYFTGTRMAEAAIDDHPLPGGQTALVDQQLGVGADYADATRIFQPGAYKRTDAEAIAPRGRGPLQQQWMFTRELFLETIPRDLPPIALAPSQPVLDKYRQWITASVVGFSLLMGLIWLSSWWQNRILIQRAEDAVAKVGRSTGGGSAGLVELQAIDELRRQILEINTGKHLGMRWLLYKGDDVREQIQSLYFRRLDAYLLRELNRRLAAQLGGLPAIPAEGAAFEPVYNKLATHLAITTNGCKFSQFSASDKISAVVPAVLKAQARDAGRMADPVVERLIDAQLDFYAQTLPNGNPLQLEGNDQARDRARMYLSGVKSDDRIYQDILEQARQRLKGKALLRDTATEASKMFNGPTEMELVFSPDGWKLFNDMASGASNANSGSPCVMGRRRDVVPDVQGYAGLSRDLRVRYLREYRERWKQFVVQQSFKGYAGSDDAANKLQVLAEYTSPILGLLAFTSRNTHLSSTAAESSGEEALKQRANKIAPLVDSVAKTVGKYAVPGDPDESPSRISKVFEPVSLIVPPDAPKLANEKNMPYLDALAELGRSLANLKSSKGDPVSYPQALQQATQAANKAADAVRRLTSDFTPKGSEGIDLEVKRLLDAPIRQARGLIGESPEKDQAAALNADLAKFCAKANPILRKYPFAPAVRNNDATLEEVASLFAPGSGAVWKLQQSSLSELVVLQNSRWLPKTEGQRAKPTQELLSFLKTAQSLTDVLYGNGAPQPSLKYTLRPVGPLNEFSVTLDFDGTRVEFTESSKRQREFTWPAASGETPGAKVRITFGRTPVPIASGTGPWGLFRVFRDADKRDLGATQVQWSYSDVPGGSREPTPPVRFEFVGSQGVADLLNPEFFKGLGCPGKAVQ
jgi:type VI secretion system protein ImpL